MLKYVVFFTRNFNKNKILFTLDAQVNRLFPNYIKAYL